MSSTLKVNAIQLPDGTQPTAADLGFKPGSVLQVVSTNYDTTVTTTNTSYVTTGLSATITPTSTSSKILILVNYVAQVGGVSAQTGYFTIYRGGSSLSSASENQFARLETGSSGWFGTQSHGYYDSPSTTSATTYELFMKSQTSSLTTRINISSSISSMTLLEIAG